MTVPGFTASASLNRVATYVSSEPPSCRGGGEIVPQIHRTYFGGLVTIDVNCALGGCGGCVDVAGLGGCCAGFSLEWGPYGQCY